MNYNVKNRVSIILFLTFFVSCFFISCSSSPKITQTKVAAQKNISLHRTIGYTDQMESFRNFDFDNQDKFKLSNDYFIFEDILKLIANSQFDDAEKKLVQLSNSTKDSVLQFNTNKILVDLLFFKSDWNEIYRLDSIWGKPATDVMNSMVLINNFRKADSEKITYNDDSSSIDAMFSETGVPIIEVSINGRKCLFWFDTGANYSVISTDVAQECDVKPLAFESSRALTGTTRKVEIFPAICKQMKIGAINFQNHPMIIVHDFDLKIKLFGSLSTSKIEGIIGWKAIQNMDVEIDYNNNKMILRKPVKRNITQARNFFWLGCPIVKIYSPEGAELNFGLDFGAEKTTITQNIFKKINFDKIYSTTLVLGSVGGSVFNNAKMVAELNVIIDGNNILFSDIGTGFQQKQLFVQLDGILGSDFMRKHRVRVDWLNGRFDFINRENIN